MNLQVVEDFNNLVQTDMSIPVCAMNSLVNVIRRSTANTWMQLEFELSTAIKQLKTVDCSTLGGRTNISLTSGCDLFMKYVTRAFLEYADFPTTKSNLLKRGETFADMSLASRSLIANMGNSFIQEGYTVLVYGNSRVVNNLLLKAAQTKYFSVIIPEGRPHNDGYTAAKILSEAKIPTTFLCDNAIGAAMEKVDIVLVGAEGVMENGGLINKIGTYQVAICAKVANKPFYVAVESYKFARMYPLTQRDIKSMCSSSNKPLEIIQELPKNVMVETISIDLTPPEYITLLFTDLGVLTPAAVSDELIKLYQ